MTALEDLAGQAAAVVTQAYALGGGDQLAVDQPQIDSLQGQVASLELAATRVQFSHNLINGTDGYQRAPLPGARESARVSAARLIAQYGATGDSKVFHNGQMPSRWDPNVEGQATGIPFIMFAPGAPAATVESFIASAPGPFRVGCNEPDGKANNLPQSNAWLNLVYDIAAGDPKVQVGDCFMQSSLQTGKFQPSWTTKGKRHFLAVDCYWVTNNEDPSVKAARVKAAADALGVPHAYGEFGDRRPGTPLADPALTDVTRAGMQVWIHEAIADTGPLFACYFGNYGTLGDHRVIPSLDPVTYAAVRGYYAPH